MTTQEINELESQFDTVATEILEALKGNHNHAILKDQFVVFQSFLQTVIAQEFPDSWMNHLKPLKTNLQSTHEKERQ